MYLCLKWPSSVLSTTHLLIPPLVIHATQEPLIPIGEVPWSTIFGPACLCCAATQAYIDRSRRIDNSRLLLIRDVSLILAFVAFCHDLPLMILLIVMIWAWTFWLYRSTTNGEVRIIFDKSYNLIVYVFVYPWVSWLFCGYVLFDMAVADAFFVAAPIAIILACTWLRDSSFSDALVLTLLPSCVVWSFILLAPALNWYWLYWYLLGVDSANTVWTIIWISVVVQIWIWLRNHRYGISQPLGSWSSWAGRLLHSCAVACFTEAHPTTSDQSRRM